MCALIGYYTKLHFVSVYCYMCMLYILNLLYWMDVKTEFTIENYVLTPTQ